MSTFRKRCQKQACDALREAGVLFATVGHQIIILQPTRSLDMSSEPVVLTTEDGKRVELPTHVNLDISSHGGTGVTMNL